VNHGLNCFPFAGPSGRIKKAVKRLIRHGQLKQKNRGVRSAGGFEILWSDFQYTAGRPAK
jgi:hypothetical protein